MNELQRLTAEDNKQSTKFPVTIVLDNIRSAQNVGSIFRTSDCLGVKEILLVGITARPPHKEISKTALGSTHSVVWKYFENAADCINYLQKGGSEIVSVEQVHGSMNLSEFHFENSLKYSFVFGNEVQGVSSEFLQCSSEVIEIQQYGHKHSMNVSVSVGIVLYDVVRKLR